MGTKMEKEGETRRARASATSEKRESKRPDTAVPHAASFLYTKDDACRWSVALGARPGASPTMWHGGEHRAPREEMGTGTGMKAGIGTRTRTEMGTRVGMGSRKGAETGIRKERG